MSQSRDARVSRAVVVALVLAVLTGVAVWVLVQSATRVGHETWRQCDADCPPEGGRYAAIPVLGIVLDVVLGIMLVPVLRVLGVGITLGLGPTAAVAGWQAAVADGRWSAEEVAGEVGFWRTVAIVGAVLAVLGSLVEFRLPGPVWRLFGWVPAQGEPRVPPNGSGTAVVTFTDRGGTSRQATVSAQGKQMSVRAWYLVRDPSRVRIAPNPFGNRTS